ncbi:hypothetical protein FOL47_006292 [Perkinsus chesapeaki]|uniref:Uncharacterized protein n=1 Tax=Perkinsus chesapeaki TaxID=330153 RepID=A0A7J6MXL4_PERCH|nr:hypothetical protein FOL47_006292 [Perkinsus chesapeaki]
MPYLLVCGMSFFDQIEIEAPDSLQELQASEPMPTSTPTPNSMIGQDSPTGTPSFFHLFAEGSFTTGSLELTDTTTAKMSSPGGVNEERGPPTTPTTGIFDGLSIESPFTTRAGLFDGITLDTIPTSTSVSPKEIRPEGTQAPRIRSQLRQPRDEQSYFGLLTALTIISGFILLVLLLQLLSLKKIALNTLQPADQRYRVNTETIPAADMLKIRY